MALLNSDVVDLVIWESLGSLAKENPSDVHVSVQIVEDRGGSAIGEPTVCAPSAPAHRQNGDGGLDVDPDAGCCHRERPAVRIGHDEIARLTNPRRGADLCSDLPQFGCGIV